MPAAKLSLESGVDIELPFASAYPTLREQVQQGKVSQAMIDRAAGRVLRAKFVQGSLTIHLSIRRTRRKLRTRPSISWRSSGSRIHSAAQRIKIICCRWVGEVQASGSDRAECWRAAPGRLQQQAGPRCEHFPRESRISLGSGGKCFTPRAARLPKVRRSGTQTKLCWRCALNAKRIAEAVGLAKKADVVILVLGEKRADVAGGVGEESFG